MSRELTKPVVHLELHTGDLQGARAFYAALCDWRTERIQVRDRSYEALALGGELGRHGRVLHHASTLAALRGGA